MRMSLALHLTLDQDAANSKGKCHLSVFSCSLIQWNIFLVNLISVHKSGSSWCLAEEGKGLRPGQPQRNWFIIQAGLEWPIKWKGRRIIFGKSEILGDYKLNKMSHSVVEHMAENPIENSFWSLSDDWLGPGSGTLEVFALSLVDAIYSVGNLDRILRICQLGLIRFWRNHLTKSFGF